jgi:hypothetical protein
LRLNKKDEASSVRPVSEPPGVYRFEQRVFFASKRTFFIVERTAAKSALPQSAANDRLEPRVNDAALCMKVYFSREVSVSVNGFENVVKTQSKVRQTTVHDRLSS